MSTSNKKSTSLKKIQLAVPDSPAESPAHSPNNQKSKGQPDLSSVEAKLTNTKNLSSSKKDSLENLKKHQSDMKRLKQTQTGSETNQGGDSESTASGAKKQKTPYEIIFDQNQYLAFELEASRQKTVVKDSQVCRLDSENFTLREYIVHLETNLHICQEKYESLVDRYHVLEEENAQLKNNPKVLGNIDQKALDLFNHLHVYLRGKPFSENSSRQSCIMSSTIGGTGCNQINSLGMSFNCVNDESSSQQQKRLSVRDQSGGVGSGSDNFRDEVNEEVGGNGLVEQDEESEEDDDDDGDREKSVVDSEEESEIEEDGIEDEDIEEDNKEEADIEEEDIEEEDIEEEDTEGEETDEENVEEHDEENEEMEHSDVVIGADQTEYTHLQGPPDVGLCTIHETTEIFDSYIEPKITDPNVTYNVCVHEEVNVPEADNICINETDLSIDESNTINSLQAEISQKRKSVTFSEKLTHEKLIENSDTNKKTKQNNKIATIETRMDTLRILKLKEGQKSNDETLVSRKSIVKRKSSIGGENGGDRRKSRIYSIGGADNVPLISEDALKDAAIEMENNEIIENTYIVESEPKEVVDTEKEIEVVVPVKTGKPPMAPPRPKTIFKSKQKKVEDVTECAAKVDYNVTPSKGKVTQEISEYLSGCVDSPNEKDSSSKSKTNKPKRSISKKKKQNEDESNYAPTSLSKRRTKEQISYAESPVHSNTVQRSLSKKRTKTPELANTTDSNLPASSNSITTAPKSLSKKRTKEPLTNEIVEATSLTNIPKSLGKKRVKDPIKINKESNLSSGNPDAQLPPRPKKKSILSSMSANIAVEPSPKKVSMLPRKSHDTIFENKELNPSDDTLTGSLMSVKDEPMDELTNETDVRQKENRPDSPIKLEGRRIRKQVSYKELPLGAKMRRDGDKIVVTIGANDTEES